MHHAHHIIQRARHHVRTQRQEKDMGGKEERRTAELKAAALAKGKTTLPKAKEEPRSRTLPASGTPATVPRTQRPNP